jgi:hypothetical protein
MFIVPFSNMATPSVRLSAILYYDFAPDLKVCVLRKHALQVFFV